MPFALCYQSEDIKGNDQRYRSEHRISPTVLKNVGSHKLSRDFLL